MRCGDSSKNGELGRRMSKAREDGKLPPLEWTPVDRRERCITLPVFEPYGVVLGAVQRVVGVTIECFRVGVPDGLFLQEDL